MNTGPFYLGVGNRCAVDMSSLQLPITDQEAIGILKDKGFKKIDVSLTALARGLIGVAEYKRNCLAEEAPRYVDCSSFTKWLYAQMGIWLPRHPIDQRHLGFQEVQRTLNDLQEGDLIFTSGRRPLYWDELEQGIGHVGMVTSDKTVIHATSPRKHIVEIPIETVLDKWKDRGSIRLIPNPERTFVFEFPPDRHVELSSAFRWKILSAVNQPSQP